MSWMQYLVYNRFKTKILILLVLILPILCHGKSAVGEYRYVVPKNVTLEVAKTIAIDRARIEAIKETYGSLVSQTTAMNIANNNGASDMQFLTIGGSDVKGEWLEDTKEPDVKVEVINGDIVITAKVYGNVREFISEEIELKALLLKNGTEDKFSSEIFRSGDELYLNFRAPINGYLAVYLIDDSNDAYCILPYANSTEASTPIKGGVDYTFFSTAHSATPDLVDEYVLTCSNQSVEYNRIEIIFSPNQFVKANDSYVSAELPKMLPYDELNSWLVKLRKRDAKAQLIKKIITINQR